MSTLPLAPIGPGYTCHSMIGSGGMGEVFLTTDPKSQQPVALKLIRPDRARRIRALRRFTREVRAMARLNHPCIVPVLDYGVHIDEQGLRRPYFVMPHVLGPSLRNYLNTRPKLDEALALFDFILSALAYAHARGIIHRDLKPENVLLEPQQSSQLLPRILDFGIARMTDDDVHDEAIVAQLELDLSATHAFPNHAIDDMTTLEVGSEPTDFAEKNRGVLFSSDDVPTVADFFMPAGTGTRVTHHNQCVGTPAYLAPEQIRTRRGEIGPAADLYACGVMLYELVCGRRPFLAKTPQELLKLHLLAPIPEITSDKTLPKGLADLIKQLLAKEPAARPHSAADVKRTLKAIQSGRDFVPPVVPVLDSLSPDLLTVHTPSSSASNLGYRSARRFSPTPTTAPQSLGLGLLRFREAPFCGRAPERYAASAKLVEAHEFSSLRIVLVDGEAGIGKTRFARWLRERASELGVVHALTITFDATSGGTSLRNALQRIIGCQGNDEASLRKSIRHQLFHADLSDPWLLPAFVRYLQPDLLTDAQDSPVPPATHVQAGHLLTDAVLRHHSASRTVLLHLDDIHNAPDECIELLHHLIARNRIVPSSALIIATLRSEQLLHTAFRHQLESLTQYAEVSRISLAPLDKEHVAKLCNALVPLHPETCALLVEHANGHPLFAIQLLTQWLAANEMHFVPQENYYRRTALSSPPTRINEVVDRRLGSFLDSFTSHPEIEVTTVRRVLEWAAIINEPIRFDLLAKLARLDAIVTSQIDLVWEAALVDGLCIEDAADESLRFGNRVIGDQLREWARSAGDYGKRQIACANAKLSASNKEPSLLHLEVSTHLLEAREHTDAWRHLVLSARYCLDTNQPRLARQRLLRAFEFHDGSEEKSCVPEDGEIFDARRVYIEASLLLNRLDEAEEHILTLDEFPASRHKHQLWVPLLRAELHARRGLVTLAVEQYRLALTMCPAPGYDHLRAKALKGFALMSARLGQVQSAVTAIEEAEGLARESGDQNLMAEVCLSSGIVQGLAGNHQLGATYLNEALARFQKASNPYGLGDTLVTLGKAEILSGQLTHAEVRFEAAKATLNLLGDRRRLVAILNGLGEVARAKLQTEAAENYYAQAIDLIENQDADEDMAALYTNMGLVQLGRGHLDDASHSLHRAAELFQQLGARSYLAVVCGILTRVFAEKLAFKEVDHILQRIRNLQLEVLPADRDMASAFAQAASCAENNGAFEVAAKLYRYAAAAFAILADTANKNSAELNFIRLSKLNDH